MVHIFLGLAGQAGANDSNGASKGKISPILAMHCLVKDNIDPLSNAPYTHATISLAVETTLKSHGGGIPGRLRCVVDHTMSCAVTKKPPF